MITSDIKVLNSVFLQRTCSEVKMNIFDVKLSVNPSKYKIYKNSVNEVTEIDL